MQSAEGRQQRRVNVYQSVAPCLDELVAEQTHEAGEADELDPRLPKRFGHGGIEGGAPGVAAVVDAPRRNSRRTGTVQAGPVRPVRAPGGDLGGPVCRRTAE